MTEDHDRSYKLKGLLRIALIFMPLACAYVTFVAYLPALEADFVNWDDRVYVYGNEYLQMPLGEFIRWAATALYPSNWHPLTLLLFKLEYSLWGLEPFGYHLTSIILHSANALVVALVAKRLILIVAGKEDPDNAWRATITGAFVALLFGLHPLHVESVAWVSETKDVLFTFFFLLSVMAYLVYHDHGRPGKRAYYVLSLALFALSLLSKPMAVTLPAVLLIIDYYPLGIIKRGSALLRRALIEKLPFVALSLVSIIFTIMAQHSSEAIKTFESFPLTTRLLVGVRGYGFYLYKTFVPTNLAPYYPYPKDISALSVEFLAPLALITAISALCVVYRRQRVFTSLWLFYLITLTPVIGIIQVGTQAAADRYMYLPSLAPFLLIGLALFVTLKRLSTSPGKARRWKVPVAALFTAAVICVGLMTLTRGQIPVWNDSISLWSRVIELYPNAHARHSGYYQRGLAYLWSEEFELAIDDFDKAVINDPYKTKTYNNRGVAYASLGLANEAIRDFTTATKLDPKHAKSYHNLYKVYSKTGQKKAAEEALGKAAALGLEEAIEAIEEIKKTKQ